MDTGKTRNALYGALELFRNVPKAIVLLFLFLGTANAEVDRIQMRDSTGTVATWATVDSSGSTSVWFEFPHDDHELLYNHGVLNVVAWFDTTTTEAIEANLDTVDVVATFEFWNSVTQTYEPIAVPVSGDTLHIKTDFRWSVSHNDSTYQFSATLSYRRGMARLKLTVSTNVATDPFRFRAEIWIAED